MPLDDEIIEENSLENQESPSDNSTSYPVNPDDPEIENDDSLVQDGDDSGSSFPAGDDEPDDSLNDSNIPEDTSNEIVGDETMIDEETVSEGSDEVSESENVVYYTTTEDVELYTDLEAFEASTIQVDLYQYTILNRLEFMQYGLCIVIALLFLQIFVRYKK